MANLRPFSLILTMLVSFAVSFSVMWWQRKTADRPVPGPMGVLEQRTNAAWPIERPVPQAATQSGPVSPAAMNRSRSVSVSTAEDSAPGNHDGPPLPVMFNIVRTTDYVSDDNHEGAKILKDVYEGIVTSESEKPLDITVIEVDLPTMGSVQTQFSLAKGTQRHFGIGDGLTMLSGHQITLRSPSYSDTTKAIP